MTDPTEHMLAILRRDGRAPYSKIARELKTNREFVASRIHPLVKSGRLRIVAGVHPKILGLDVAAHLSIRVGGNIKRIVAAIDALDAPNLISVVVGSFQIIVELRLRSMAQLRLEIGAIRAIKGVREVHVLLYEEVLMSFFQGGEPGMDTTQLDAFDVAIIRRLANDGRANFADIATAVGLSLSGCRMRVQKLIESNVIHVGAIKQRADMTDILLFGIGANTRESDRDVIELLSAQPRLEFLGRTVGRFDLLATVGFGSLAEFNALVTKLRSLPSVTDCEQWLHVSLVRERYEQTLDWLEAFRPKKTRERPTLRRSSGVGGTDSAVRRTGSTEKKQLFDDLE